MGIVPLVNAQYLTKTDISPGLGGPISGLLARHVTYTAQKNVGDGTGSTGI